MKFSNPSTTLSVIHTFRLARALGDADVPARERSAL